MFHATLQKLVITGLALALILVIASSASAQRFDRGTTITINHPFEIPGKTLPAGEYVIRLMDIAGIRNVVQILNADETKSFAIVLGITDYTLTTPENTEISFYETERGAPLPIHAWFYPGYNYGVEFVYPKKKAVEIAEVSREHVIALTEPEYTAESGPAELLTEPLIAIEPGGKETELAAVHPEPTPPSVAETAEPVLTAEAETPPELPKTATPVPLASLAGLFAAGAAGVLLAVRRRRS
jgi:LPXTG-motif cell wall-anchored protein